MLRPFEGASDSDLAAAYERHFASLAALAEELGVPADEAGELISDILLATLFRKPAGDVDQWLAAALRAAVRREKR